MCRFPGEVWVAERIAGNLHPIPAVIIWQLKSTRCKQSLKQLRAGFRLAQACRISSQNGTIRHAKHSDAFWLEVATVREAPKQARERDARHRDDIRASWCAEARCLRKAYPRCSELLQYEYHQVQTVGTNKCNAQDEACR